MYIRMSVYVCKCPYLPPPQFSHGTVAAGADSSPQLADILKFGLDTLLQSDERYVCSYMYISSLVPTRPGNEASRYEAA